jgi:hypothetical protein
MDVSQPTTGAMAISGASATLAVPREILSELGRATTAYHDATPDRLEQARQEYEEALQKFNATSGF